MAEFAIPVDYSGVMPELVKICGPRPIFSG
jgi:hypothetical protein